jgi:hypothetical protein
MCRRSLLHDINEKRHDVGEDLFSRGVGERSGKRDSWSRSERWTT